MDDDTKPLPTALRGLIGPDETIEVLARAREHQVLVTDRRLLVG